MRAPRHDGSPAPDGPGSVRLMHRGVADDPLLELAVSHALLREASEHEVAPVVRVYQPSAPMAVFGRRDVRSPGFSGAVERARDAGFAPAVRVTGGRAVAYTTGALVVDLISREADAMLDHDARFERYGRTFVDAFRNLGVDARLGAVPGEYCPGAHSVNARGTSKLVGTSQRVVRNAWLFSALVVVDDTRRIRPVLSDLYADLGQPFDPVSVGSLVDEAPGVTLADVEAAILAALEPVGEIDDVQATKAVARARTLRQHHEPSSG